jgi:hypothetical protein
MTFFLMERKTSAETSRRRESMASRDVRYAAFSSTEIRRAGALQEAQKDCE